jgi:uncharacterized protein (DUF952 family)/protein associated with RNAse G/E
MSLLFHLAARDAWIDAVHRGEYVHPSLGAECFIHASTEAQVVETANRHYAGRSDVVLVCIDQSRLKKELRWELAPSVGQEFPHIYGPVNLDAVTQAVEMRPATGGIFLSLPAGIEAETYGDSIWLRAVNFDGSPHWSHPAPLVSATRGPVITQTAYGTVVAREEGSFTSNFFTRGHYWPDRWYNVIRLEDVNHQLQGYYCNIAEPVPFDGSTVSYVDLQLDVRVFLGGEGGLTWRLLDEDEFEEARRHYGYGRALVERCYRAVDECVAAIKARRFPFDG